MPLCGSCGKTGAQLYQGKNDKSLQVMACSPECAKRCAEMKVLKDAQETEQPVGGERSTRWKDEVARRDAMRKKRMAEFMRAQVLGELGEAMYQLASLIDIAPESTWQEKTVRGELDKIQDAVTGAENIIANLPENTKKIGASIAGNDIKKQLKAIYKALGALEKDLEREKRSLDDLAKVKTKLRDLNQRVDKLAVQAK